VNPTTIGHVVVVVPAHNEIDRINRCLESLNTARDRIRNEVLVSIVVVADRCSDHTATAAVSTLDRSTDVVLVTAARNVGHARQLGTETGLRVAQAHPTDRVWLANTDADTVVPPDWLDIHTEVGRRGFTAVAGRVELDRSTICSPTLEDAFARRYAVGLDGHDHVHGANLGCRADAYVAVGGWRPIATGEDHDLWNRLRAVGPVLPCSDLVVATDARLVGRAPEGFARDMAALAGHSGNQPQRGGAPTEERYAGTLGVVA
jgi:glycosyltransferase involved in cell wall biosynthesis